MAEDKLRRAFSPAEPDGDQRCVIAEIRAAGLHLAQTIEKQLPSCADRSSAIRQVRDAVQTAEMAVKLQGLI